jgi:DtxR family transcriptional regulator, Mn-dependent transcriptional regulator
MTLEVEHVGPLGRAPLSPAVEDYLKTIYTLRAEGAEVVTTQALANRLSIAPPSATAMAKKLAQMGFVKHEPYRGIDLTETGLKIALEVVRHHRIIETYLTEVLGLPWDKVHDEAERLEHVLSEDVEAAMMEKLGHPTRDPHGSPIPSREGELPASNEYRLCEVKQGFEGAICRVEDENSAVLRHLNELGLGIGDAVFVTRAEAYEGVLHLRLEQREVVLGVSPAAAVWVSAAHETEESKR